MKMCQSDELESFHKDFLFSVRKTKLKDMNKKMPNRFDIIYANSLDKNNKENAIGYVLDIREAPQKSKNVVNGNGMPTFTPLHYYVQFLNKEVKIFPEDEVLDHITSLRWVVHEPTSTSNDKALYQTGDLFFNKVNNKVSLVIGVVDTSDEKQNMDQKTKDHSRFWYKVQAPGQRWEPLSETFVEFAKEKDLFSIQSKKPNKV